jgi:hypothetical protein
MKMTTTSDHQPDAGPGPSAAPVPSTSAEAQALITEQQVLFSTAAAVALTPAKTRRFTNAVHAVVGSVRTWLVSAAQAPVKPVYPKRHTWLENSLMSREMGRL